VTWDDDTWTLQTTYPDAGHYQARASLANGYIGINLAALGPFFEVDVPVNGDLINGWPLFDRRQTFATIGGFYDVQPTTNGTNFEWLNVLGGESVISGIPHWSALLLEFEGNTLSATTDVSQITAFSSSLDIGSGVLSWHYTWSPPGKVAFEIEYSMFAHKLYVNQAVTQLKVTSSRDANVTISDVLDGDAALRTCFVNKQFEQYNPTIWTAVQPLNIPYVTAYVYSTMVGDNTVNMYTRRQVINEQYIGKNSSSIGQFVYVNLKAGQTTTVEKYLGIASTDAFKNPQAVAENASLSGKQTGYVNMLHSHIQEWQSIMTPDSLDDFRMPDTGALPDDPNVVEQQILAVTNPFALLQNTVGQNAIVMAGNNTKLDVNSISVCGLGSECYAGLIFWDAEVWMAPGLVVAFPEAAKQIANYRREKYAVAKQNVQEAYTSSQNHTSFSNNSAIFSWTSGRFGNCTGTGPCFDYEYHINGDIGLELENYYIVTGDTETFRTQYFPIYDSVAQVYSDLLHLNGTYMLLNATDPDEYANAIDNPGYTMVLIQQQLERANMFRRQFGLPVNNTWTQQAANIDIPFDKPEDIILEYTGMSGSISVKQADVVLVDDFLDYQNPYTLSDLDFYAGRQSLDGPGMTYGVFSVIAAEASPSGCSDWTYDLYGSQPYSRAPWFQFSEQLLDDYTANGGTHPAYPFLTGMGGANRVSIFGYLGLRLRTDSLNVSPTLPPQLTHLNYRTFYWQGHAINATANSTYTAVTRLPLSRSLPNANPAYAHAPIPLTLGYGTTVYHLPMGVTLLITNRQIGLVKTIPGNLAQCLPVTSPNPYLPGQFPLSAVDGAVSTKWQPLYSNTPASLTVDLGTSGSAPIIGFAFDWAQTPPRSYNVTFSNSSSASAGAVRTATTNGNVQISNPYNAINAAAIAPYTSNTTNVTLATPVWGGRYATLTILGNLNDPVGNGTGASVAEWAIIMAGAGGKVGMLRYYGDAY